MNTPRILIAGIGNIFLGDDAFGVEVARKLSLRPLPDGVVVRDFGIRGLDLTYALMDGYETVILVDAMPRGEAPGTLYVLEPELIGAEPNGGMALDMHRLDPATVLRVAASLGSPVRQVLVVGCEPQPPDEFEEMADGLSEPVQAAVAEAVRLLESLVEPLLHGETWTAHAIIHASEVKS